MQDGYVPGATVASRAATIAADIAAIDLVRSSNMQAVLFNLGANDSYALPAEATWKANLATILDAMNAQWPAAKVYVMRPWTRAQRGPTPFWWRVALGHPLVQTSASTLRTAMTA